MQCLTCILVFSVLHWTTYEATYVRSAGIGSAASGTNSAVIFPVIKQTVTTTRPATERTHLNYMENKFSLGSSATGKNPVNFIDFGNGNIRPDSKDGDCRYLYNKNVTSTNFVTFNTGLGTSVSFYEQRKNLIIEALLQSEADVLCLNELWYVEDLIQIQKALQGNFPHSFSIIHDDAAIIMDKHTLAQPPCASVTFRTTMKCFMTHCNTSRNLIEQAGCFLVTCNAPRLLSVECLTCVIISGTHTVNVIEKCANTSPSRQFNAFNLPGLALFSKLPLAHRNRQNLIPNVKRLVSRWVLSAEVEKVGRIGCTHFTALMPFSYVDHNYNVLRANGLSDPYVDNGGLPTFGRGNPLSIFQDRNLILDHIFHKGFDYISSKRVFDKFIGVKGQSIPLSDHFGVSVTLQLKNCTALP
ncbi:uncharacterized protein LOC143075959 isoform X5 [Mytilus galloprovincialis]|uniref:uncharacterized protein LOC143075959 isoform X5 n=1 Tax=Mytilus galloprovincialis TaxID=29158 RepID=UPI003F7B6919